MIRQAQLESKSTRQKVLSYIGMVFRHSLQAPDWYLDSAVADFLIKCVSVFLSPSRRMASASFTASPVLKLF